MHFGKNLEIFWRFCNFCIFSFCRLEFLSKGSDFWKKSTRFAGFLAVIFTSQRKNLQKFMHSESFLEIFWKFCTFFVFKSYYRTRRLGGGARQWFSGKKPPNLLVFWLWFSPPNQKIFSNFCILKKIWGILEDFVNFLAFHFTDWHSSPKEMIFMKKSIRFAGFLAVIFTSKWKKLQKFMHSEQKIEDFWKIWHPLCVQKLL